MEEAAMSVGRSADQEASPPKTRRGWERPVISELALRETMSKRNVDPASPPAQRAEPPLTKLGFSFEASFPLSARMND
jgi:hypothetical protein